MVGAGVLARARGRMSVQSWGNSLGAGRRMRAVGKVGWELTGEGLPR